MHVLHKNVKVLAAANVVVVVADGAEKTVVVSVLAEVSK
jgi:hypothetical protein